MKAMLIKTVLFAATAHVSSGMMGCFERESLIDGFERESISIPSKTAVYVVSNGCQSDDIYSIAHLLELQGNQVKCTSTAGMINLGVECAGSIFAFRELCGSANVNMTCDGHFLRFPNMQECQTGMSVLSPSLVAPFANEPSTTPEIELNPETTTIQTTLIASSSTPSSSTAASSSQSSSEDTAANHKNSTTSNLITTTASTAPTSQNNAGSLVNDDDLEAPSGSGAQNGNKRGGFEFFTQEKGSTTWIIAVSGLSFAALVSLVVMVVVTAKAIQRSRVTQRSAYINRSDDLGFKQAEDIEEDLLESKSYRGKPRGKSKAPRRDFRDIASSSRLNNANTMRYDRDWCKAMNGLQGRAHLYGVNARTPGSVPILARIKPHRDNYRGTSTDCSSDSDLENSLLLY